MEQLTELNALFTYLERCKHAAKTFTEQANSMESRQSICSLKPTHKGDNMLFELLALYTIKSSLEGLNDRLAEEQARKERNSRRTVKKCPPKRQK